MQTLGWGGEKLPLTAPPILLGASALLTALLAWQAFAAAASHRALAQRVLHDYAELAAIEFSRRTTAFIGNYGVVVSLRAMTQAARDSGEPLPSRVTLEAAMPVQSKRARELVGPMFRFDASRSQFRFESEELPLQTRSALLDAAHADGAARLRSLHQTLEGQARLYVFAPVDDGQAPGAQWLGFQVPIERVAAWMAEFIAREPLLPTSLVSEQAAQSSLVVTVRAPDGSSIFRLPDRDSRLAPLASRDLGGDPAITGLGGFHVDIALDPAAASSLVIGGLPRSQTPFLLALLVLSAALTFAAGIQIRRERRHAQMRHDFITRASHELRTPVARIRMFTETLLLDRVRSDDERTQTLQALDRGARRLSMLIDNVLQLSPSLPSPALRGRERVGAVDVAALLDDIVREFAGSVDARAAIAVIGPKALPARLDAAAFRQVLMNLLDNAWKYGGSPPAISVALSGTQTEVSVAVEDDGPGVPERHRNSIWEPYVRLERDRRSSVAGTGIGLAVVRDLMRANGGTYRVESGSRGARFVVTFPILPA
jgi:signal transduction histidine kinase